MTFTWKIEYHPMLYDEYVGDFTIDFTVIKTGYVHAKNWEQATQRANKKFGHGVCWIEDNRRTLKWLF